MKIYVGNLEAGVSGPDLHAAFGVYGDVTSAKVSTDNSTGASRGFGFVEMAVQGQGEAAITGLNRKEPRWQVMPVQEGQTSLRLRRKEISKQVPAVAGTSSEGQRRAAPARPDPGKNKQ